MTNTDKVRLGAHGPEVFPLALGCMGMGGASFYGDSSDAESDRHHPRRSIAGSTCSTPATSTAPVTTSSWSAGRSPAAATRRWSAVKFGALRGPDGGWQRLDARPVAVKNFLTYSLTRLGVDHVDIYRPARLDPAVPIEDTIGAIADLVRAGYVRYVGVSELGAATIRRAAAVHPIVDLQIEYSLVSRGPEADDLPDARGAGDLGDGVRGAVARPAVGQQADRAPRLSRPPAALSR
jgi:hypothetical protein